MNYCRYYMHVAMITTSPGTQARKPGTSFYSNPHPGVLLYYLLIGGGIHSVLSLFITKILVQVTMMCQLDYCSCPLFDLSTFALIYSVFHTTVQ